VTAKWPSVQKISSNFETAYSNPTLIEQITPELHELVQDHVELCKNLEQMEGPLDIAQVADALQIIDAELKTHFVAEEEVVFPLLANYLGGMDMGPIGIMMEEHRNIRSLYSETMDVLASTIREAGRLAEALTSLSQALVDHLGKEDTGIFLMAGHRLNDEEKAKISRELPRYTKES
jgi:iron-sulfur cluster repair protein YtfE (RIC family)